MSRRLAGQCAPEGQLLQFSDALPFDGNEPQNSSGKTTTTTERKRSARVTGGIRNLQERTGTHQATSGALAWQRLPNPGDRNYHLG